MAGTARETKFVIGAKNADAIVPTVGQAMHLNDLLAGIDNPILGDTKSAVELVLAASIVHPAFRRDNLDNKIRSSGHSSVGEFFRIAYNGDVGLYYRRSVIIRVGTELRQYAKPVVQSAQCSTSPFPTSTHALTT